MSQNSKINFTLFAQNTDVDYVQQACLCAMSIKNSNPNSSICLVTNDVVPDKYQNLFDYIREIPWGDAAQGQEWKIHNRWKVYHVTPYDNTIVLDVDMLVLDDLSRWWEFLQTKDLFFTSNVRTYRNDIVTSRFYRPAFDKFDLPDTYVGFYYFKKSNLAHTYFKWLELAVNNWEKFQGDFAGGKYYQRVASIDMLTAIIIKILGIENEVTCKVRDYPHFTHMKLHCQNWTNVKVDSWQKYVGTYLTNDGKLKIGNYFQQGVFHYTEDDFVNDRIVNIYEKLVGV